MPWRQEHENEVEELLASSKQLCFGILRHDGSVTPHPPVRRAMSIVVDTLEKLGHQMIEWTPPSHANGNELCAKTWTFDGGL